MPKIKVKNIPRRTRDKMCNWNLRHCSTCPFYLQEKVLLPVGDTTSCIIDGNYDPKETIIELPEKYFPTNREWLESLSDEDFASLIACKPFPVYSCLYGVTVSMIKDWLSKPCEYLMEEE